MIDMSIAKVEELADNLESYVKHLYALRACMQIKDQYEGRELEDLEADYQEAMEIKDMWDSLGEE
jgi:hypothetical protein